jgi:hypothetical protein
MPFKTKAIHVDDGSEFRADFEDSCQSQSLNISLFVLLQLKRKR